MPLLSFPLIPGCSQDLPLVVMVVVMMVVAVMMMTTVEMIVAGFGKNNDDYTVNTMSNVFSVHGVPRHIVGMVSCFPFPNG